jgi:hypothetical protein
VIACLLFVLIIILSHSAVHSFTQAAGMNNTIIAKVILLVLFANASLFTTVIFTFFLIMSPERTAVELSLYWFPVKTHQRKLGFYLPLIIAVLLIDLIIFLPILVTFSTGVGFSAGLTALVTACFILQILTVEWGTLFFVECFTFLYSFLRIGGMTNKLLSISSSGFIFLFLFLSFANLNKIYELVDHVSFNPLNFALIHLGYALPAFQLQHQPFQVVWCTLLPLVSFACFIFSTMIPRNLSEQRGVALFKTLPFVNNKFFNIMIKEWKDMIRHPDIFMMLIIYLALVIFVGLKMHLHAYLSMATLFLWVLIGILSYSSFGRDEKIRWMVYAYPYSRKAWIMAKLAANIAFNLVVGILFVSLLLILQGGPAQLAFVYLPVGMLVTCVCFLAGILLPYSQDHPYSTAFSSIIVCLVGLPLLLVSARVLSKLQDNAFYLVLSLSTLLVIALTSLVEGWRHAHDRQ